MTKTLDRLRGRCGTCRNYAEPNDRETNPHDLGTCRAHAPILQFFLVPMQNAVGQTAPQPVPVSGWPLVKEDQWCAEWASEKMVMAS